VKLVTLEGGFDPTASCVRRDSGLWCGAARGKRRSDYLIERAQVLFPGSRPSQGEQDELSAAAHPQTMHPIKRAQFAEDAANKLGSIRR